MRLLTAALPSAFEFVLLGDTHEGSRACAGDLVDNTLEWVMEKRDRFWAHMGDPIEAITCDDKRFTPGKNKPSIPVQEAKSARKRYRKAASRNKAFLAGNHDGMLIRFGDLTRDIICDCDDNGRNSMPYGGRMAKLSLSDKHGPLFKLFLWHPSRVTIRSNAKDWQQQIANRKARLKMLLEQLASDCLIMAMGHIHQLLVVDPAPRLELYDDGERLHQRYLGPGNGAQDYIERDRRWYCATGSYLRSQMLNEDTYAEIAGYPPVELGHVLITVEDRKVVRVVPVVQ